MTTNATPISLAKAIGEWIPGLNGRSIAVSDVKTVASSHERPTMPLAMVAFGGETAHARAAAMSPKITETIVVEIWRKNELYKLADGSVSPFYAYVDYRSDRDAILHGIADFQTPDGSVLSYVGCTVQSDEERFILELTFSATYVWCDTIDNESSVVASSHIDVCLTSAFNARG